MTKTKVLLFVSLFVATDIVNGQNLKLESQFDTIPKIISVYQNLTFHDEVRCAAYLFIKDFRVFDSLGNVYVNLYINPNFSLLGKEHLDGLSKKIFQAVYRISIHNRIEYFTNYYKEMVVNVYNENGVVLTANNFKIEEYSLLKATIKNLDMTLSILRIPTTWRVINNAFENCFFCADTNDRSAYHMVLLRFLKKMDYLDHKWKEWRGSYISCNGENQLQLRTKLNYE